jgi:hypothetical protein
MKELLPQLACKDFVTIRDNGRWQPMKTVDLADEKLGNLQSGKGVSQRDEMCCNTLGVTACNFALNLVMSILFTCFSLCLGSWNNITKLN